MQVVGLLQQHLDPPDGNTYLGSGKNLELVAKVEATSADTVIVDSELTPRQLRNLSRQLGDDIRLCDRTALILDIFKTRALSREGQLQVLPLTTTTCPALCPAIASRKDLLLVFRWSMHPWSTSYPG